MKLLLCCTKQPLFLVKNECDNYYYTMDKGTLDCYKNVETYNGKIIAECDFEIEEHKETTIDWLCMSLREKIIFGDMCKKANIDELECYKYANGKPLYAIHIKNLNIFDKPKELNEYWKNGKKVEKTPQNMMIVQNIYEDKVAISSKGLEVIKVEKYILISVKPEELVRVCNDVQSLLVRKKVLKEMISNVL